LWVWPPRELRKGTVWDDPVGFPQLVTVTLLSLIALRMPSQRHPKEAISCVSFVILRFLSKFWLQPLPTFGKVLLRAVYSSTSEEHP